MAKRKSTKNSDRIAPSWIRFPDPEGGRFLLSSEYTARFFGVTPRTLLDWEKKGAPKASRGWWDPKAIMEWREGSANSGVDNLTAKKLKAEVIYKEAKAAREQRMNLILEGEYVPLADIEDEWARRVTEVKSGLLALTNKIAGQITDPDIRLEVEQVIRDEVYELLEQYARDGTYTPNKRKAGKKG